MIDVVPDNSDPRNLPVAEAHAQQRAARPVLRGRATVVIGYLIGDDSTLAKSKGKKMEGGGLHHSPTAGTRVRGHSLVQGLYRVEGRSCPLPPLLYRQQTVCAAEGVPFHSKIALREQTIRTFEPTPGTRTHVLLDTGYSARSIWKAARARHFLITTGLKKNRRLRVPDPEAKRGWRWQTRGDAAAGLDRADDQQVRWPAQGEDEHTVYMHVVSPCVRKLYRCQVIVGLQIAMRWKGEVLFADTKEILGLDQYQIMSAQGIVRFWTLVLATYTFREEERARLQQHAQRHVTLGQTRRTVQATHQSHLLTWIHAQYQAGATPDDLALRLAA